MKTVAFSIVSRYMASSDAFRLVHNCYDYCTGLIEIGPEDAFMPLYTIYKFSDGSAVTISHTGTVRFTATFQEAERLVMEERGLSHTPQELH